MYTNAVSSIKRACALAASITVAGCVGTGNQYPNQPAVPIGSQVQLNLEAEIPVDQNRIFIQNRMVVSKAQIDTEQVYCSVVMDDYQQAGSRQLKLKPGKFSVWRVRLYNDFAHNPTIYANNDDNYYAPSFGVDFRTELHLKSSEQPDVSALSCTDHRPRYQDQKMYPDRSQFEATLGDFVTLP